MCVCVTVKIFITSLKRNMHAYNCLINFSCLSLVIEATTLEIIIIYKVLTNKCPYNLIVKFHSTVFIDFFFKMKKNKLYLLDNCNRHNHLKEG